MNFIYPPAHPDYRTLRSGDYARTTGSNMLVKIISVECEDWNNPDVWVQGWAPRVTFEFMMNKSPRDYYTWRLSDLKPLTSLEKLALCGVDQ